MAYTVDQLEEMIGLEKVPGGSVPAAWWVTTDADQLAAWARYEVDMADWRERAQKLLTQLGLDDGIMINSFGKSTRLVGIQPSKEMRRSQWSGTSLVPEGWRIDSKSGYLVPSRRTKKDRESQANKDFGALAVVPDSAGYVSGLPAILSIDDTSTGGHWYSFDIRKGERCLFAFCGGDPDRADKRDSAEISDVWERQRISSFVMLRERKSEAKKAAEQ